MMAETLDVSQVIQIATEGWGALFCIIAIIVIWQTRWSERNKVFGLLLFIASDGLLLLFDMLATSFRGHQGTGAFYIVRIAYILTYLTGYFVIVCGVSYFGRMIEERAGVSIRNWRYMEYIVCGIGACLVLINIFFPFIYRIDENNNMVRLSWSWVIHFVYLLAIVLTMVLLLNFFRELTGLERFAVISALIFPLIALGLRYANISFSLTAMTSFLAVVFTFISYMIDYSDRVVEREREREKWIAEENIRLLHDQIKPHFIYNALTGIYYGMDEDPSRAKKAVKDLSGYLRGSLDVLDERDCVDFSRELDTVRCYLEVESFRFEDQIHVDIETEDTDFQVPAFCIQTLVENAVRHGIREKNPPEGTVSIRTNFEDGAHIVTITDDGVGFDPDEAFSDDRVHIGLRNTKKRLELMCGGSMEVKSKLGEGTSVRISIPETEG